MTLAGNGKEGTSMVGREASELQELGGLISPSVLENYNFSAAFMTPEMVEEKKARRVRLKNVKKVLKTARLTTMMLQDMRDKQQSQAFHSFLGGMKSQTKAKNLTRHVRDENWRLFAATRQDDERRLTTG